jgi:hypothetical protein
MCIFSLKLTIPVDLCGFPSFSLHGPGFCTFKPYSQVPLHGRFFIWASAQASPPQAGLSGETDLVYEGYIYQYFHIRT